MTMNYLNHRRKGQSAIEYLTTYGWMLLVVAIVGGAIFTTVQGQSNIQSSSGLANADVQIANFGITSNSSAAGEDQLAIELRGAAQEQVEITSVEVTPEGAASPSQVAWEVSGTNSIVIPVGSTDTFHFGKLDGADTQNTFDVVITYNTGGLDGLEVSGTLTGRMDFNSNL